MISSAASTEPHTSVSLAWLGHPLDAFYAQVGVPMPPLQQVDALLIPEPYRQLLVHQDDMTPTLERFHRDELTLHVLGRRIEGDSYHREVVLSLTQNGQPVEFGAIKIFLDRFPAPARKAILEEHHPLGHILASHRILHSSRPRAFLRVASDPVINQALRLQGAHVLYGRRNALYNPENLPLAEIVEILPPSLNPKTS